MLIPCRFHMNDPFHSLAEPCHISSSQEDLLRNCPLAPLSDDGSGGDDSEDSGIFPVESVGIIMISLPESTNDESAAQDEFQTPPEEVQPASSAEQQRTPAVDRKNELRIDDDKEDRVAADLSFTDGAATVELGKDSDLGFLGPTSEEKVVAVSYVGLGISEVSETEVDKFRVFPRESQEASGEPSSKKPKIYEENLDTGSPQGRAEVVPMNSIKSPSKSPQKYLPKSPSKSPQILKMNTVTPGNYDALSPPSNQGNGTMLPEDSPVKKKLCFQESEYEDAGGVSGLEENHPKADSDVDDTKGKGVENGKGNGTMLLEDSPVKKKLCFQESKFEDAGGVSGLGEDHPKTDSDVDINKGKGVENGKSNGDVSEIDELQSMVGRNYVRKTIEDLEKFKYIVQSVRNGPPLPPLLSEVSQGRRELPLSIRGPVEDAASDSVIGNRENVMLLEILKILCGECDWSPKETEETDILEIAKRRGMTFPRPRWWSPSDSEEI